MQTATTDLAKIHPDLAALNALGMHRDLGGCPACRVPAPVAALTIGAVAITTKGKNARTVRH